MGEPKPNRNFNDFWFHSFWGFLLNNFHRICPMINSSLLPRKFHKLFKFSHKIIASYVKLLPKMSNTFEF